MIEEKYKHKLKNIVGKNTIYYANLIFEVEI